MKLRLPGRLSAVGILLGTGLLAGTIALRRAPSAKPALVCDGEYSDSLQLERPAVREIEQGPRSAYAFLIRSTAKYECPYFAPDGKLRRRLVEAVEHGTAFAYEVAGNETYLLTNEHIAVWPEVTDTSHRIEGVQEGCKRLEEKLRIVHDEHDDFEPGHLPLVRVAADARLDAAILKANQALAALPYRIGKSSALRQGNAVQVR